MPFSRVLSLADLDGSNGFRIDGDQPYDQAGVSVSSAGDFNGDGFADILVGAPQAAPGPTTASAGESYIIFGKASFASSIAVNTLNGSAGSRFAGEATTDRSGQSISTAGDINNDGFDDIIIGAFAADNGAVSNSGASYVIYGGSQSFGSFFKLEDLDGTNGFRVNGQSAEDLSGFSVSDAGDVNGDGFADFVIGAKYSDSGGSESGAAYIVFGNNTGFPAAFNLTTVNSGEWVRLSGISADDQSGISVSSAGDFNGDGFDDVIIGAYGGDPGNRDNAGESYVVFGRAADFQTEIDLASLNGSNGFRLNGIAAGDHSGRSLHSAGDVNGDGFDDIIIGARLADPGGVNNAGESYIVFGRAGGLGPNFNLSQLNGGNGFTFFGLSSSDNSGLAVSAAGDVNGDGFDDVIIGAPNVDSSGKNNAGESYVVFGKSRGFAARLSPSDLDGSNGFQIHGIDLGDNSGRSVASAGDVNGDLIDDLIIGANRARPDGDVAAGEAYVVFGMAPNSAMLRIGGAGDQKIVGSQFDDTMLGLAGEDTLLGGGGNDRLNAGSGNDELFGGDGADTLVGSTGIDSMFGATGEDVYFVQQAGDMVSEIGSDHDTIFAYVNYTLVDNVEELRLVGPVARIANGNAEDNLIAGNGGSDSLRGAAGDDTLSGNGGGDELRGGDGNDRLLGSDGFDTLLGGDDDDRLEGASDVDILDGGRGDDTIFGGAGRDTMTGGSGADRFSFDDGDSGVGAQADRIMDFSQGQDRIHLTAIDANGTAGGEGSFAFIGTAAFSGTRGELRFAQFGGRTEIQGDTDGNGVADIAIRLEGATLNLVTGDFLL